MDRINKKMTIIAVLLLFILSLLGFTFYPWSSKESGQRDKLLSGYIEGTEVNISSKIPGKVEAILVQEGDRVEAGQVLVRLESRELIEQLNQAKAALAQAQYGALLAAETIEGQIAQAKASLEGAQAHLQALEKGPRSQEIAMTKAAVDQARASYENAKNNYERMEVLFENGAVPAKSRDDAKTMVESTEATYIQAREKLAMVEEGSRSEEIDGGKSKVAQAEAVYQMAIGNRHQLSLQNAVVEQARAALEAAQAMVDNTEIKAPQEGIIAYRMVEMGEMVIAGMTMMTIVNNDQVWVRSQVPEDLVTTLSIGQELPVYVAGVEEPFTGTLVWINASADFATRKATQDLGDFDVKTFAIKIQVDNSKGILKNGMTARVLLPEPL
ncbi:HlyD family secretion protein [Heliorestis convoluta]|uniref:HlyD family secretion protein, putative n=1 Tax=Heliorestis convoluta TaxID=356322 RepID=A0A5Q2MWQ0_9FIRM|nr:efflux RND transporter periplasmic adaptor subunit [Heliorestis convoluta]QGG46974.1 HlyD family secretion protein, putative [Heliorestis convoluta]